MPRDRDVEGFHIEKAKATKESASGKALLVEASFFDEGKKWIPKSQIHDDSEVFEEGGEGTLVITKWLAEKEGWT